MEAKAGKAAEEGALSGGEAEIEEDPEQELEHKTLVARCTLRVNPLGGEFRGNLWVTLKDQGKMLLMAVVAMK